ncbi:EAL domain-containing protein [Dyella kyungheensis]|uniref:EAL domain-containing protein n=1 Tax=Dyella kyungheensis TaxID=1242174 RepID=A0ABS2JXX7_9GAMM|nr:EAL domain-containing protein [Dyella kyungheensis]MBM7123205.1 EAL domain-containing protein [Dyella kyungheensis]
MPVKGRGAELVSGDKTSEIVMPFVLVVVVMIGLCVASLDILSAARAFVGGESRWSKAQKIAVSSLQHYLTSNAEADYQQFLDAIAVPLGHRAGRIELDRAQPDMSVVTAGFRRGGTDEADIPGMARLYRYFHHVGSIRRAVDVWVEADRSIDELIALGTEAHRRISAGERDRAWRASTRAQLRAIDERLTPMEYAFSDALASASRETANLLRACLCLAAATMVLIATRRVRRLLDDRVRVTHELRASEDRFQLAVAGSNDGLWDWDRTSGHVYLSPRLRQMLGLSAADDGATTSVFQRLHPQDRRRVMRAVTAHVWRNHPLDVEFRVPQRHGVPRWFHARGASSRDATGTSRRMAGSVTEITERRRADAMLFAAKERAEVTLQSIGDAVITTDATGCIEFLNPSAERLTRWSTERARGRPVGAICHFVAESSGVPIGDPVMQVLDGQTAWSQHDKLVLRHPEGPAIAIDLTATPIRDRAGNMDGAVLVMRDVSSDREHAAQLSYQASHDVLTGLINRREFERRLALAVKAAESSGRPFTVLYLDLDQFKVVNDTCSHAAGDELLRQIGTLFLAQVRATDAVARLGGDEFVVLLEDCDADAAVHVAESLRAAIGDLHFAFGERSFATSASIGLVSLSADERLAREDILGAADAACHLAKEKGRNRVQTYHLDDDEVAVRQIEMCWVSRIQAALASNRFELYEQDIVDLRHHMPQRHVELLLRMVGEGGELIPPRAFIPSAERYGLMPSIDRWVVQSAFSALREAMDRGMPDIPSQCAINLSGTSLCESGFAAFLRQQFATFAIAPSSICFEITETAAISSLSRATAFIHEMRALGCYFSLDDFGAGMSSFTYLKHLPVDFVKIEGSFVKDMIDDPIDYAMVEAINNLGHVTRKQTIAECVGTPELLAAVHRLGIDFAQGFVLSVPRPFLHDAGASAPRASAPSSA